MKISIILPVYNAERTIRSTVQSILAQTLRDFELIAIDDGSTDCTLSILTEYQSLHPHIRIIENGLNLGLIKTLNRGMALACGEYIVRMDADDIMEPYRLAMQVAFMDAHPECVASGGQMRLFGDRHGQARFMPLNHDQIFNASFMMCPIYHPTAILRTKFIRDNHIMYNEEYIHAEDYKLWSDILKIKDAKLANIPDCILHYRTSSTQVSTANAILQFETSRRIKRENINSYLSTLGLCELNPIIDVNVVKDLSTFIHTHSNITQLQYQNLILILCMLYMSLEISKQRVSHFVKSQDYKLFCNKIGLKWGITIFLSWMFPNRWKGYLI